MIGTRTSAAGNVARKMSGRLLLVACAMALVTATTGGCAGQKVAARAQSVRAVLQEARASGAYRCAPRFLAMGETHLAFAESELHQGDYFRARDHVEIAEANAAEAVRRSPGEKCTEQPEAEPEPPVVVVAPRDSDQDGLLDPNDKCVVEPEDKDGFEDDDGCPDPDNDNDGVLDAKDKCPDKAEDRDRFEDEDGCPETDNDKDGVLDAADRCPDEAEDQDGFEDEDGCPERDNDKDSIDDKADKCPNEPGPLATGGCPQRFKLIEVKNDKIELLQKLFFDTAKARIQPRSFPLLDEVAEVLRARQTMKVRIEGHTDTRGKRAFNVKLSQQRADSVRAHLMGLGVEPGRLEAIGYGPDQPIENNLTAAGRDTNRRVEFFIVSQ